MRKSNGTITSASSVLVWVFLAILPSQLHATDRVRVGLSALSLANGALWVAEEKGTSPDVFGYVGTIHIVTPRETAEGAARPRIEIVGELPGEAPSWEPVAEELPPLETESDDLPPLEAVENEDWGRDYVLQHFQQHTDEELAAAGLNWQDPE